MRDGDLRRAEIEKARAGELPTDEVRCLLQELIARDGEKEAGLNAELGALSRKLTAAQQRLDRSRDRKKTEEALQTEEKLLQQKEEELAAAAAALEQCAQQQEKTDALKEQITALTLRLPDYEKREELRRAAGAAAARETEAKAALARLKDTREGMTAELQKRKEEKTALDGVEAEKERLLREQESLRIREKDLSGTQTSLRAWLKLKSVQQRAEQDLEVYEAALSSAKQREDEARLLQDRAARIDSELEQYDRREEQRRELKENREESERLASVIGTLRNEIEEKTRTLTSVRTEWDKLSDAGKSVSCCWHSRSVSVRSGTASSN